MDTNENFLSFKFGIKKSNMVKIAFLFCAILLILIVFIKKSFLVQKDVSKLINEIETIPNGMYVSSYCKNKQGDITEISLYGEQANEENLEIIARLLKLEKLTLGCSAYNSIPLTEHSFSLLKSSKNLTELILFGAVTNLTKDICKSISELSNIQTVKVDFCKIDKKGIEELKQKGVTVLLDSGCE